MRATEQILTQWFDAFREGDLDRARALYAPDAVWHVSAEPDVAGDFSGFDQLQAWFEARRSASADFSYEVEDMMGSYTHAVALLRLSDGSRTWRQVAVYRVVDGRIAEAWLYE
jgi:uncharacterized protein